MDIAPAPKAMRYIPAALKVVLDELMADARAAGVRYQRVTRLLMSDDGGVPAGNGVEALLVVDGQRLLVRSSHGRPGEHHFGWLDGPEGYGFGSKTSTGEPLTRAQQIEAIRRFLRQVSPDTGYIE